MLRPNLPESLQQKDFDWMARRPSKAAEVLDVGDDDAPRGKNASVRRMSLAAIAAMLNRDRNTVMKWTEQGCPVITRGNRATGTPWELDVADVVEWLEKRSAAAVAARFGDGDAERIEKDEADRRRAIALMVQDEADAAERLKEVVAISLVSRSVSRDYANVRKSLLGLGAKAGMRCVGQPAVTIQETVDGLISESLSNLVYDGELAAHAGA